LTSLNGLNSITSGVSIQIEANNSLSSLNGLGTLISTTRLEITGNNSLTSLNGLDALTSVSSLWLYNNHSLIDITALSSLSEIDAELYIVDNALPNLTGLEGITSIGQPWGVVNISFNFALTSLTGLNSLTSIGGVYPGSSLHINVNSNLVNLNDLSSLTHVNGFIEIIGNSSLTSLNGLGNIDASIISNLKIINSPLLSVCDVSSICTYLSIPCNPATISGNAIGCLNRSEVEELCDNEITLFITTQPQSQTVQTCSNATFSVTASGTPPFQYQWYKNGILIQGSTSSTYTTPTLTLSNNGNTYYCKVSHCNGANQVTSNTAVLTVISPCIYSTPSVSINSSTFGPNQTLIISGNNFSPYGGIKITIEHESGTNIGDNIPIIYSNTGTFEYSFQILPSHSHGTYFVRVEDLSTSQYAPTVSFLVNNEIQTTLQITSPVSSDLIYLGDLFNITWIDFVKAETMVGQTGFTLKEYKIEITNNNGVSWMQIQNHSSNAHVGEYNTFSISYNTFGPGTFKIRITDWDDLANFDVSETFNVFGCNTSGFVPSLEWDPTVPKNVTKPFPHGLAADGTARIFIRLNKKSGNPKVVSSISAEILPIDNNYTGPALLGKLKYATNHLTYSDEANSATNTAISEPFQQDGNLSDYYFWLVAPDDYIIDINDESEYRKITINFTITYTDNTVEGLTLCKPVYIYRPALIFVHGIGGSIETFEDAKYLNNSGGISEFDPSFLWKVVRRINLKEYASYAENANILLGIQADENYSFENSITSVLRESHNLGIASKRVDYVAHSMGGAVGRKVIDFNNSLYSPGFQFKNYKKGYINKFISICTPHNGSYLADFVIDRIGFLPDEIVAKLENTFDFGDDEGSFINTFFVNGETSPAAYNLQAYNGGIIFGTTPVLNHLIGSDIDINNGYSENFLIYAINHLGTNAAYTFLRPPLTSVHNYFSNHYENDDYLSNTDMVVNVTSQMAGGTPQMATNILINPLGVSTRSIIYGLDKQHVGISKDLTIGTRIKRLLNAQKSSGFFASEIPANEISQNFSDGDQFNRSLLNNLVIDSVINYYDTIKIKIIEPSNNSIFYVDSSFQISIHIKDTTNLQRLRLIFQTNLFDSFSKDSIQIFQSTIHSIFIGNNSVFAIAEYDSLGYTINHVNTININVNTLDSLIGFNVIPEVTKLNANQIFKPKCTAIYSTFIGWLAPDIDSLTHMISDTNVIIFDSQTNQFITKDTGSTHIVFYYANYQDTTFIYISESLEDGSVYLCPFDTISFFAGSNDSTKMYQWQIDTLNSFINISDNINYSGTDSCFLTIISPPSQWYDNSYRCVISDPIGSTVSKIFTLKFRTEWEGTIDTAWENSGNWSCNSLPDCNTDVLIPSGLTRYPEVHSEAFCRTIAFEDSSSIEVKPGFKLWIGKTDSLIVCPDNILVTLEPGQCSAIITYPSVQSSCGEIIQTSGIQSGNSFPIGTTTNCFEVIDLLGSPIGSCCFEVVIEEYPNPTTTLACNDNVQVLLTENCEAFVSADMILEGGPYTCYNNYLVEVQGYGSGFGGVTISSSSIGQTLNATITEPSTGNSCWGTISVEDQIPPQVTCSNYQIPCGESTAPDTSTTPEITDNCGVFSLTFSDSEIVNGCPGFNAILRHWVVTDSSGNTGACDQIISFLPASLDSVQCPPAFVGSCGGGNPNYTGYPMYNGNPIDENGLCNLFTSYSDQDTIIDSLFTIIRTWTIVDTCTSEEIECLQNIISSDDESPIITCPAAIEATCIQSIDPSITGIPVVEDDCFTTLIYADEVTEGDCITVFNYVGRTWTAIDNSGNSATCTQSITILMDDSQIICPANIVIELAPGQNEVQVVYIVSTACNCTDSVVQISGIESGDFFPIGTTANCFELIDTLGMVVDSCCFDVVVNSHCLSGGISFNSQAEIDMFPVNYPMCSTIEGPVTIEGADISNLNGLSAITHINGDLIIWNNNVLSDLSGLDALIQVGGLFTIANNEELIDVSGFNAVTDIGIYLQFILNNSLTNISGFNSLSSVPELAIQINNSLTNISGLTSLSTVEPGSFMIYNNDALLNLNGLSILNSIGGGSYGGLYIQDNSSLPSLTSLSAVTSVGGPLNISDNSTLTSLTGLDNIDPTTITNLIIQSSNMLSTCDVRSICDYLAISSNPATISGNASDCATRSIVEADCMAGFELIADTVVCSPPDEVTCIDIKVNDFEDIIAMQFSVNWDSTKFIFDHVDGFGLPGLNPNNFGTPSDSNVDEGEVTIQWIDLSLNGVTVPDLSTIFRLCLLAVGPVSPIIHCYSK